MNDKLKDINEIISTCKDLVNEVEGKGKVYTGNNNYTKYKKQINTLDDKMRLEDSSNKDIRVLRDMACKYYFSGQYSIDIYQATAILNTMYELKHALFPDCFEKIFISHCSLDIDMVSAFIELLYVIGIPQPLDNEMSYDKVIFCSSLPSTYIDIGKDFSTELYNRFNSDDHTLFIMWYSDNYLNSQPCLNEAGAIWAMNKKYISILSPGFSRDKIKMMLNDRCIDAEANNIFRLNEIKKVIEKCFDLSPVDINRWNMARDKFVSQMESATEGRRNV